LLKVKTEMSFNEFFVRSKSVRVMFAAGMVFILACSLASAGCNSHLSIKNTVSLYPIADEQQIYSEYLSNQQSAILKYEGKKFQFPDVYVDQLPELTDLLQSFGEYYVQSGMVKFRSESPDPLANVQVGQTVFIIGTVTGMQFGYLNIQLESIVAPPAPPVAPY
jgi:hypothetical protein